MHSINRGFLIFSLIFSFTIPIVPVGMIDLPSNAFHFLDLLTSEKSENVVVPEGEWYEIDAESALAYNQGSEMGIFSFTMAVWLIYLIVSGGMFIRLIRIVHRIQLKTDRSDKRLLHGTVVVLLSEDTTPHTFQNMIFLNKRRYLNGEIPQEVIVHEMTHARQKHSLDILFVEFLKILFWFNPLIYLYKNAILLNHEFLADEAVLAQGNNVKDYQKVLLKSLLIQPSHRLASTLNYSLTKK
ncbi:MAG: M56 family metallopeptidase, partial [Candidatus Paceibacterota bacterium]